MRYAAHAFGPVTQGSHLFSAITLSLFYKFKSQGNREKIVIASRSSIQVEGRIVLQNATSPIALLNQYADQISMHALRNLIRYSD